MDLKELTRLNCELERAIQWEPNHIQVLTRANSLIFHLKEIGKSHLRRILSKKSSYGICSLEMFLMPCLLEFPSPATNYYENQKIELWIEVVEKSPRHGIVLFYSTKELNEWYEGILKKVFALQELVSNVISELEEIYHYAEKNLETAQYTDTTL